MMGDGFRWARPASGPTGTGTDTSYAKGVAGAAVAGNDRSGPNWGDPRRHPGAAHYPSDPVPHGRREHSESRRGAPYSEPRGFAASPPPPSAHTGPRTVPGRTHVAPPPAGAGAGARIIRSLSKGSRRVARRSADTFNRVTRADGADESGLAALTYTSIINFAADAVLAVALANTLFFASASAESQGKVALYLLVTIAPFAVIAPVIGPALDRVQRGRRLLMSLSFAARAIIAVILAINFDNGWILYPAALAMMVLSKTYSVLKGSMAPRVLPPQLDLVRVNSRLTVIGHVLGSAIAGPIAAAIVFLAKSNTGALWFLMLVCVAGAYLCMQIPRWAESTEGEVPATFGEAEADWENPPADDNPTQVLRRGKLRQPLGRDITTALWANGTVRMMTGFLTLFVAFVAKATSGSSATEQLMMLGLVGAAATVGTFAGNATAARLQLGRPVAIALGTAVPVVVMSVLTAVTGTMSIVTLTGLVASFCSAVAKASLDACIQDDLPEQSRASAFGRSETILQLSWVFGGAMGVLLPTDFTVGFAVMSVFLGLGLAQTWLSRSGNSLLAFLPRPRLTPVRPASVPGGAPDDSAQNPATEYRRGDTRR